MIVRPFSFFVVFTVSSILAGYAVASSPEGNRAGERPAIVLVAFGTSNKEARKTFDHIDAAAKRRYPEYEIHWAFTSDFIRKKLERQGIRVKSLSDVVKELKQAGRKSAVFQSLHVAPGQEYEEIGQVDASELRIAVGSALLADEDDIQAVAVAMHVEIKEGAANVFVCHGNRHHPQFNRQLVAFARTIEAQYDNVVVCSLNGRPGTDKLVEVKRKAAQSGAVHFIPMMVVAGVHVADDVLGEGPESWKNVVGARKTTCARPLGYNDKVLAIYFQHLDEAIEKVEKQAAAGDGR